MLESMVHADSAFVTLTYSEDNIPKGGTLVPEHARNWLKRLRREVSPRRLRYYIVGEYGDVSQRPHYHVAIFGLSQLEQALVDKTWTMGFSYVGDLSKGSAQYIAGYVTKKMTQKDDPRLGGRIPEFARMSLKPGIGALSLEPVVSALQSEYGSLALVEGRDVPHSLLLGANTTLGLGRYLRGKLRERIGMAKETPPEAIQAFVQEMSALFEAEPESVTKRLFRHHGLYMKNNIQKLRNQESRYKLYTAKERSL